jgi:hypothetical protein
MKTIFSRQFARWWDFRKSQWDNRGIGDSEEGLSAFLEASTRRYKGIGAQAMVSAPSFKETIQRLWQHKLASRQLPEGQAFPAYREVVERRLAPHHFTRHLQLKKNPRQQTKWADWLEYLNYEQWWLEKLTALAEPLEEQYHQAFRRLLEASRRPSREIIGFNSMNATNSSAALVSTQARQRRPGAKNVDLAKESKSALAALDATNKMIDDFVRETEAYTYAHRAAYYQRHRLGWIIKEARLMETEMVHQSKTVKGNTKVNTNKNQKRRRGDDDDADDDKEMPPEPRSKIITRRDSDENVVSGTRLCKPRRSKRLANLKDKASLYEETRHR